MPRAQSCISAVSSRSSSNSSYSPPQIPGLYCVGWVQSAHGIRGELFVRLKAGQADWLGEVKSLSLVKPGEAEFSKFEIEKISPHKGGLIVRLKDWRDRNQAELWRKSSVYISEDLLEAEEGETIFLKQVLGFAVIDLEGKALGVIRGFASNGSQDLLRVYPSSGGEALIPFVDAFIRHIDFDKQELTMDLPSGLFDLDPEG